MSTVDWSALNDPEPEEVVLSKSTDVEIFDAGADDFAVGPGDQMYTPGTITYVNENGVTEYQAEQVLRRYGGEIASAIEQWSRKLYGESQRARPNQDPFLRDRYQDADHIFAQMAQCASAVENDDVLSTLADVMEGLAFQKMRFEMYDLDQQDVWNQIAADLDLDTRLREMWREIFKVSQVYVGIWWERKQYKVRDQVQLLEEAAPPEEDIPDPSDPTQPLPNLQPEGKKGKGKGKGNRKRKKVFDLSVPGALTIFDPTKIVPVGTLMFNRERFAYVADKGEDEAFSQALRGDIVDETVLKLIESKYQATEAEKAVFSDLGVDHNRLWLFKKDAIFRHTLTRAQYERWSRVRLKPILPILDLKNHLRASDRAALIGSTNFIVVITKGTDDHPAKQPEIDNLHEQARIVARMPVLVGDHRLNVAIVSPPTENTLTESRYQLLDARLVFKAVGSFMPVTQGGNSGGNAVSEMSRVVSKGIENRRHELARTLEAEILKRTVERNEELKETPSLEFTPKRVSLNFSQEVLTTALKLRDRGDLSRETVLEEMDFDQDVEYLRRAREHELYDKLFQSQVPHSSPASNPFQSGAQGGRPPGVEEMDPRKLAEVASILLDMASKGANLPDEDAED